MRVLLAILISAAVGAPALAAQAVRAGDLKQLVEARNGRVRAKEKERDAAAIREATLVRSFLPSAELYSAHEKFKKGLRAEKTQPAYGGEVRVNLFNGGRDALDSERSSLVAERKRHESVITLADELGKARENYWRIIYLRDYAGLLREARKSSAESLQAAERRIRSGVATGTDRVEFEMLDIDLKRELERADLERKNLERTLAVQLGFGAEEGLEFPEELKHEHDWEMALKHTEEDHSFLVRPAELLAREAEAQSLSVRRSWLPKVDAFAAYHQYNQREEEDHDAASARRERVVGLRLTMNLFDGFLTRKESSALAAEAAAAEAEAEYVHREIEAHLHGEIAELKLLHAQVHEAEENVRRGEQYLRLTQSEYSRGVKNSPDMVGAMEKLTSMRQKRLEIVRDFQISRSHVLAKLGR